MSRSLGVKRVRMPSLPGTQGSPPRARRRGQALGESEDSDANDIPSFDFLFNRKQVILDGDFTWRILELSPNGQTWLGKGSLTGLHLREGTAKFVHKVCSSKHAASYHVDTSSARRRWTDPGSKVYQTRHRTAAGGQ